MFPILSAPVGQLLAHFPQRIHSGEEGETSGETPIPHTSAHFPQDEQARLSQRKR